MMEGRRERRESHIAEDDGDRLVKPFLAHMHVCGGATNNPLLLLSLYV
jgi:hypothetical protein